MSLIWPYCQKKKGIRRGVCTKLTLSLTNPLCAGKEDAFSDAYVHSKALNTRLFWQKRRVVEGVQG